MKNQPFNVDPSVSRELTGDPSASAELTGEGAAEIFRADGKTFVSREALVDYLDRKTRNEREETMGVKTQRLRPTSTRPPTVYPEVWNHMPESEREEEIRKFELEYFPKQSGEIGPAALAIIDNDDTCFVCDDCECRIRNHKSHIRFPSGGRG